MKAWLARRRLTSGLRMLGHRPAWARDEAGAYAWCRDCARKWSGQSVSPARVPVTLRLADVCKGRP